MTSKEIQQDETLQEIIKRIVAKCSPDEIYLFGSRAYGAPKKDSDYDLLIVVPEEYLQNKSRMKAEGMLYRALMGIVASVDLLLYTHHETMRFRDVRNHVINSALVDGMRVYAGS